MMPPTRTGKLLGTLPKGQSVDVLEKTTDSSIDGNNAPWFESKAAGCSALPSAPRTTRLCTRRAFLYHGASRGKGGMMPVIAVVGANWGDEGKGKITDYLAREVDFVVRYQGGNNAGHTIINEFGKFALHLLPSGVFYPGVINILGPGVAVNVTAFLSEIEKLLARRRAPAGCAGIRARAGAAAPSHSLRFPGRGEAGKRELRLHQIRHRPVLRGQVAEARPAGERDVRRAAHAGAARQGPRAEERRAGKAVWQAAPLRGGDRRAGVAVRDRMAPYVADTTTLLLDAVEAGKTILLEGQLGTLRDPDHGIYPYPTSSSPLAGFGAVGAGLPPWAITRVVAVTKAYSSCVGAGPFVTELHGEEEETLRKRGGDAGEYGATTGRPRRVGWFDCVATSYGCRVQGATEAAITNLDVLGYKDTIPVCTDYTIDGKKTSAFPVSRLLDKASAVYAGAARVEDEHHGGAQIRRPAAARARVRSLHRKENPHADQMDLRRPPTRTDHQEVAADPSTIFTSRLGCANLTPSAANEDTISFMIEFFRSMKSVLANHIPSSISMPDSLKSERRSPVQARPGSRDCPARSSQEGRAPY